MTAHRLTRCTATLVLAFALAAAGCIRPDDSVAIHNHYDHAIEFWSVFEDGSRDHRHGSIQAGQLGPLILRDCLRSDERIEIRHPDGRVLEQRGGLCSGDRWDVGAPDSD